MGIVRMCRRYPYKTSVGVVSIVCTPMVTYIAFSRGGRIAWLTWTEVELVDDPFDKVQIMEEDQEMLRAAWKRLEDGVYDVVPETI